MLQFCVDYELDELLELSLWLLEDQFQVCLKEPVALRKSVLLEEAENVSPRDMTFTCSINSLEEHNGTEFACKTILEVEAEV